MKGMPAPSPWLTHAVCCRRTNKHPLPPCELSAGRPAQTPVVPGVSPAQSFLRLLYPHPRTLNHIRFEWFGEIKANSVHKYFITFHSFSPDGDSRCHALSSSGHPQPHHIWPSVRPTGPTLPPWLPKTNPVQTRYLIIKQLLNGKMQKIMGFIGAPVLTHFEPHLASILATTFMI